MRVFDERIVGAMHTVTLADAKAHLDELMDHLQPGEAILMMDQGRPLAHVRKAERDSWTCKAGTAVRKIHMAPDFGTVRPQIGSFSRWGLGGLRHSRRPGTPLL